MRVSPVAKHSEPNYPMRGIIDQHPDLLNMVPRRWQSSPAVIAALTAVCALMAGSRANAEGKAAPVSRVAPVFMHGEGRGAFGCVAVNPPLVLSEAEARQVVVEEAKRAGISFSEDKQTLKNIAVPVDLDMKPPSETQKEWIMTPKTERQPLTLDGTDTKRSISYEYVSQEDFHNWTAGKVYSGTIAYEDVIDFAKTLRDSIADSKTKGTYAVFYDPYAGYNDAYRIAEEKGLIQPGDPDGWKVVGAKAKEIARTQLRLQVQDFIKWMNAQGAI